MSRSGAYYVIKAMDRTIAGAATADAPKAPKAPKARAAHAAARPNGRISARIRHLLAKVHNGDAASQADRARRNLHGAARQESP
jgi:hypothetical protein